MIEKQTLKPFFRVCLSLALLLAMPSFTIGFELYFRARTHRYLKLKAGGGPFEVEKQCKKYVIIINHMDDCIFISTFY